MNLQFAVQNGAKFPQTEIRYKRLVKGKPSEWLNEGALNVTEIIKNPNFKVSRDELATLIDNITFTDEEGNLAEVELDICDLFYLSDLLDALKEGEIGTWKKEAEGEEKVLEAKKALFESQNKG
jgi:hypothetical protein